MNDGRINTALREATDTENVTIGSGVLTSVDGLFGESFGDRPAIVVADENTFAVAGKEVRRCLEEAGRKLVEVCVLPRDPPRTPSTATPGSRYTILHPATETGILDGCIEEVSAPDGFWARDAAPRSRADRATR